MRDHIFERQFLALPQPQRELPVEIRRLDLEQRGGDRQDRDRDVLGGQPPQPDRALLQDLGVRREVLQRHNVERRKELRAVADRRPTSRSKKVWTASESASACLLPSTTMTRGSARQLCQSRTE